MSLYNKTTLYPAPIPTGMPSQNQQDSTTDEVLFPLSFSDSSPIATAGIEIPSQLSVANSIPSMFCDGNHHCPYGDEDMDSTEYGSSPISYYSNQQNQPLLLSNNKVPSVSAAYSNYVLSNGGMCEDDDYCENVFSLDASASEVRQSSEEASAATTTVVPPGYSDYTTSHMASDSLDNVVQQNYRLWLSTV